MPAPILVVGGVAVTWSVVRTLVVEVLMLVWNLVKAVPAAAGALMRWLAGVGSVGAVVDALTDGAISAFWGGFAGVVAKFLNITLGTDSFRQEEFVGNTRRGFAAGVGREIAKQSGVQIRDILDKEKTIEDLEIYALGEIQRRSGVKLTSLRNVEAMKRDFARFASSEIAERVGLPLSNILDHETTKMEILDWAQDQVMMRISDSVSEAVAAQVQKGGATLLKTIQDKIGKRVSGRSLLMGINDAMAGRYMVRWEAFRELSKQDRRKLQNKIAQRRFRDKANPKSEIYDGRRGGRMEYIPLGWYHKVEPPNTVGYVSEMSRKAKSALAKIKEAAGGPPAPAAPPAGPTEAQVPAPAPALPKPAGPKGL